MFRFWTHWPAGAETRDEATCYAARFGITWNRVVHNSPFLRPYLPFVPYKKGRKPKKNGVLMQFWGKWKRKGCENRREKGLLWNPLSGAPFLHPFAPILPPFPHFMQSGCSYHSSKVAYHLKCSKRTKVIFSGFYSSYYLPNTKKGRKKGCKKRVQKGQLWTTLMLFLGSNYLSWVPRWAFWAAVKHGGWICYVLLDAAFHCYLWNVEHQQRPIKYTSMINIRFPFVAHQWWYTRNRA
jgi:hypothetical protein